MTTQGAAPAAKPSAPAPANTGTEITPLSKAQREIRVLLERSTKQIAHALPATLGMKPEAVIRAVLSEVRMNPLVAACDPITIVRCAMECAQLGLVPNRVTGHVYLVPFTEKKKQPDGTWTERDVCTTIVGYRGLIDLARRSGNISTLDVYVVHAKDEFTYHLGDDAKIVHVPWQPKANSAEEADPGHMVAVYAIVKLRDGGIQRCVMTTREVDLIKARSKSAGNPKGPWHNDYEEMAKKTAVRRIWKMLPVSVEALNLIERERIRDEGSEDERKAAGIGDAGEDLNLGRAEIIDEDTGEVTKTGQQQQGEQPQKPDAKDAERSGLVATLLGLCMEHQEAAGDLWGGQPPVQTATTAEIQGWIGEIQAKAKSATAKPAGKGGRS